MDSERWQRLKNDGARMQRLLWASTSTKDPNAPDDLYLYCLGAPFTINTIPEATLRAFYDHGHVGTPMPADGGDADETLAAHAAAGIDVDALAAKLQADAATSFVDSWNDLMSIIDKQIGGTRDMTSLRERPAWAALEHHYAEIRDVHLRDLFAEDAERGERLTAEAVGLYLDYSKNRVTDETLRLLLALAEESGVAERRDAMFRGDRINTTENRSVLHVALRMPKGTSLVVDGVDVVADVHDVLDRMADFSERIRSGEWKGHTGKPIRNVVNVGIGGSDLGPVMAYEALRHYTRRDLTFRFVSNVDSTDFVEATRDLDRRRDALRHLLEDVHDARDDDERAVGP